MAIRTISTPESANVAKVEYDDDTNDLYMLFHKGSYRYRQVPVPVADGFSTSGLRADAYFRANILGQYPYERIG